MFTLIYRWRLKPGMVDEFTAAWAQMTEAIYAQFGSLGSRLHRAEDGTYIAYAQWPDKETWLQAGRSPSADPEARAVMRRCTEEALPDVTMTVTKDLLKARPSPQTV